ncbi:hypothetical protein BH10PAT1_BH10PAT1_2070 [soil metagenome]
MVEFLTSLNFNKTSDFDELSKVFLGLNSEQRVYLTWSFLGQPFFGQECVYNQELDVLFARYNLDGSEGIFAFDADTLATDFCYVVVNKKNE